jgi:hypothetical protein
VESNASHETAFGSLGGALAAGGSSLPSLDRVSVSFILDQAFVATTALRRYHGEYWR